MAKILKEEWDPDTQDAREFVLARFAKDRAADFMRAIDILEEIEEADELAGEWFGRGPGIAHS